MKAGFGYEICRVAGSDTAASDCPEVLVAEGCRGISVVEASDELGATCEITCENYRKSL